MTLSTASGSATCLLFLFLTVSCSLSEAMCMQRGCQMHKGRIDYKIISAPSQASRPNCRIVRRRLTLPAGASIEHAMLQWAYDVPPPYPWDSPVNITVNGHRVSSDRTVVDPEVAQYFASADVTRLVKRRGTGMYSFSRYETDDGVPVVNKCEKYFKGANLFVVYSTSSLPRARINACISATQSNIIPYYNVKTWTVRCTFPAELQKSSKVSLIAFNGRSDEPGKLMKVNGVTIARRPFIGRTGYRMDVLNRDVTDAVKDRWSMQFRYTDAEETWIANFGTVVHQVLK